ncbi:MAG: SDR family NAD(P)-dependent oxidoreductase [Microcystaceae cyanobacterium]
METALITGASSGIGEVFAKELASRQTNLILVARSQDKLEKLADDLQRRFTIQTDVIVQDLTDENASQTLFENVKAKGLNVDLLINNAGFGDYGTFSERSLDKQTAMIQLNITALVELTHLFLPQMIEEKQGKIINVASIAAFQPLPYFSVYSATKAFVLSFSEALWAENKNKGIKILALCPGPTESDFFKAAEFPQELKEKGTVASAETVVKEALIALEKNQSNLVTGGISNNLIVNLPRFFPREFLISAVEKQFSVN